MTGHAWGAPTYAGLRMARSHRAPRRSGGLRRNTAAEFRRLLSVRGWLYQLVFAVGVPALLTFAVLATTGRPGGLDVRTPAGVRLVFAEAHFATLMAVVLGMVSVTNEYRHKTIGTTLLAAGRPHRWLIGKLVVVGLLGALFTTLAQAAVLAIGLHGLHGRGVHPDVWTGPLWHLAVGNASLGFFCALWGVGLGLLLRHQVVAVTGVILYTTVVESLLVHYFPREGRYLPGGLQMSILGDPMYAHVSTAAGYGLFAGWIALALVAGWIRLTRGDVPA